MTIAFDVFVVVLAMSMVASRRLASGLSGLDLIILALTLDLTRVRAVPANQFAISTEARAVEVRLMNPHRHWYFQFGPYYEIWPKTVLTLQASDSSRLLASWKVPANQVIAVHSTNALHILRIEPAAAVDAVATAKTYAAVYASRSAVLHILFYLFGGPLRG